MFHFGFSYVGFIYLLMLFIPNIIWTKHKPVNYEEYSQKESKLLQIIEKIGEILVEQNRCAMASQGCGAAFYFSQKQ